MKFSEKWLREWVNPNLNSSELANQLIMAGLEVESITSVANPFQGIVIGQVLEVEPHPNADRLKVCKVDIGESDPLLIVCGATNVRSGMKVPVALIGAELSPTFKIQKSKLRGVDSFGMLCSSTELGMADKSQGLMELPEDAPIGKDLKGYLDLNDKIFELKVTPNRGDCLSIAGIAREVKAITQCDIHYPEIKNIPAEDDFKLPLKISSPEACPRYLGRVIKDLNLKKTTPLWMREKLRRSNIRSINPVVDITNYVMLELGQPLHAFDLNKITERIEVRFAEKNEKIKLLNEQDINLDEKTLIIADAKNPLAIAGAMGGISCGVTENTQAIFLESAFFKPDVVAHSTQKYRLFSDASQRFERGVDPDLPRKALDYVTQLILQLVGGTVCEIVDATTSSYLPKFNAITLRKSRIQKILGIEFSDYQVTNMLERLNMNIEKTADGWRVTPPHYRFDIQLEIDIIEELARIFGYQNIPVHIPTFALNSKANSETKISVQRIKNLLADRGYFEIMTYSFVSKKIQNLLDPQNLPKELLNPISQEMDVMRTNLWPGLINTAIYNLNRQETRLRSFEIGMCFVQTEKEFLQQHHLAGVVLGSVLPEQWGIAPQQTHFFDIKSDVEALLSLTGKSKQIEFRDNSNPALQSNQAADIYLNNKLIGYVGRLHPKIAEVLDVKPPIFLFELDLSSVQEAILPKFEPISAFPIVRRDIAIIVDQMVSAATIEKEITNNTNQLLKNIKIFDIYQGKGIEEGKKSIALGLLFQHYDRTLVDAEINKEVSQIVDVLKKKFNAKLRE